MYTQRQVEKLLLEYSLACDLEEDTTAIGSELRDELKVTPDLLSKAESAVWLGDGLK